MVRLPLDIVLALLLLLGGFACFSTLRGTPAFNSALQEPSVLGSPRFGPARNRYDQAEYLKVLGITFQRALLLPPGIALVDGESGSASPEATLARATRSSVLLARSLAQAPADADTWRYLAWSVAMVGDAEAARVALAQSWDLAPYHRQLATGRLDLVPLLFGDYAYDPDIPGPRRPSEPEHAAVMRDLETLRLLAPGEFGRANKKMPEMFQ